MAFSGGMGSLARADRFGSLRARSKARQRQQDAQAFKQNIGPSSSLAINSLGLAPEWDAYFQALDEQGVSGLADDSVGQAKGMFPLTRPQPRTAEGPGAVQTFSPLGPNMGSNQIGVPGIPALDALERVTGAPRKRTRRQG